MSSRTDFLVWGNNQGNLLSKSNSKCLPTPVPLTLPYSITSICSSQKHISFIAENGNLYSFGSNLDGRLGVSTKAVDKASYNDPVRVSIPGRIIKVECGFSHVCALTENLQLYAWGLGDYGGLGIGQFRSKSTPTVVDLPKDIISNLRQFSCGAMHTAFVTEIGDVYMCGSNQYGQLGISKPEKIASPMRISFHLPVQQVSCGVFYTLLLTKEGRVYGMGNNKYGQLGIGHKANQSHPTLIRDLDNIAKVSAGYHSGAIDYSGNLYIWGSGSFGELLKPKKIVLSVPIKDIAVRGFFGLAIGHTSKFENRVYTWGNNTFGQLGVGTYEASQEPLEVETLRGLQIGKIALGVNFAILALHPNKIPEASYYKSPRMVQRSANLYSDRKQITNFDQIHLLSQKSANRSRSRDPIKNYYVPQANIIADSSHRNYQKLFLSLSEDYEILMQKYQQLQKQFQIVSYKEPISAHRPDFELQRINNDLTTENIILKEENSKLNYSLIKQQQVHYRKIDELKRDKDNLLSDIEVLSHRKYLPEPDMLSTTRNINEIELQYNNILNEKQKIINKLKSNTLQVEKQLQSRIKKLQDERSQLQLCVSKQIAKNSTIATQYTIKLNNFQEKLGHEMKKNHLLEEDLIKLKKQLAIQDENIKKYEILNCQLENSLLQTERKNQMKTDELLKREILHNRIEELQVELNYEKQYNKKLEGNVHELQQMKQQIYKQLMSQIDHTKSNKLRIQELKGEVENYKKYKQESDEKSIQIQQFQDNFNQYKNKTDNILSEKQKNISDLEDYIDKSQKQHSAELNNRNLQIQQLNGTIARLDKQINKNKQTIAAIKQQLLMKDQQLEHISQSKNALEKKCAFIQNQLKKQTEEREAFAVENGENKREISKLKLQVSQLQVKLEEQKEKNSKLSLQLSTKIQELQDLTKNYQIISDKAENLRKQNKIYREQIQVIVQKLQRESALNEELIKANKQFASGEQKLTAKINEQQRTIDELQSQNKSYTPRYEALLQRNHELDERNKQLGEMINKAIEIQAESYKNNILKEVQINTDQFLNDVQDEQEFKSMARRNKKSKEVFQDEDIQFKSPPMSVEISDEPYTRMMKERLSNHKRRVSDSAYKLAHLLDINDGMSGAERRSKNIKKTQDYEKVNSEMQQFHTHKEQFISKIHSFAEKLKIL